MTGRASTGIYIKTCETLCRHFRLEMFKTGNERDAWEEILRNSGLRYTETVLEGRWWKGTHGAFLGELDDGSPVAILPSRLFGYAIYNSVDESRIPVNAATAKRLRPAVYTIYRTFPKGPVNFSSVMRFILAERIGKEIFLIALFGFLASLIGALPPIITAQIFDDFVPGGMLGMITQATVILLCFNTAQMLFHIITNIGASRLKAKAGLSLDAAALDRILSRDMSFFEGRTAGETLRDINAVGRLRELISLGAVKDILTGFFFFVSVAVMFNLNARAARWSMLIFLPFIIVCAIILAGCFKLHRMRLAKETICESVNMQASRNAARIHDAGAEERAFAVWLDAENQKRRVSMDIQTKQNLLLAFLQMFKLGGMAFMFLITARSGVTAAVFVGFSSAFMMVQSSLTAAVRALMKAPEFCALCASLKPALTGLKKHGRLCPRDIKPEVEVRGLSYFYGDFGKSVVNDVSFSLRKGDTLGIYGRSGSGKTTLAKLLLGLYKPKAGRISIGGYENNSLDPVYMRRQWGIVTQESGLTAVSLYRFLASSFEIEEDLIYEALAKVKMADQIRLLGLRTRVESCGFSKGEMERLMAVRIILGRQRLVIFDEPTDETAFNALLALDAARIIMTDNKRFLEQCGKIIRLS
ncbi:MAG: ATP-binding cassette domain-containing protein [Spirochaetaceae bacterium]|jgi:ATP-binding cassette subfamily C protein|nr:ATP-binding cassette domain-containing protein [Spirochaetaceae bacterium]